LLNVVGYFDHLHAFTQHGVNQGFIRKETEAKLIIKEDPKALLDLFLES
jgi:predicted Rossmann-fold nucleotide-binding protein